MKASCNCVDNVRTGSFEEIPFRICLNCQFLEWDNAGGFSFIQPRYTLQLTLPRSATDEMSILEFLAWLDALLKEKPIYPRSQFLVDYEYLDFYRMDEELSWDDMMSGQSAIPVLSLQLTQAVTWWGLMVQPKLEDGDDLETLTSNGHFIESRLADYSTDELLHGTLLDMRDHYGEYLLKDIGNRVADALSTFNIGGESISAILKEYDFS